MIRRILVPLDGSENAKGVLGPVADLAGQLQAEVEFIQVVVAQTDIGASAATPGVFISPELVAEQIESDTRAATSYLVKLAESWKANGLDVRWEVVSERAGGPASAIVEFARDRGVDLIAMSTHGRSGISRLVFGSIAEQVVRDSGMPVLLVRPQHKR